MRVVFGLVLILGLGLAGFAVYMAKNYIQSYQAQLELERANNAPVIETVEVYVANQKLEYGQRLLKKHVKQVTYPAGSLPDGTFATIEALFPEGEDEPRTVLRTMEPSEAILKTKVTGPGEDAGITSQLERGMRAFAIKVDVTSGVSGFLRPGDRVDVYWTGRAPGSRQSFTQLIETGVRIVAVDQVANVDRTETLIARTITVSIKPQQVAALAQAQSSGRLSLSLVGAEDDSTADAIQVDQRSLLGIVEAAPRVEAPAEKICTIKTRRGGEVITTPIPCATN
ncbi:Flp pilus assembly protein CpaB [Roseovarius rhodophyticola]|uniref:Flp pilus assembly protein CpaB n=1 Tax=Roseovarius rhodophyticola TaxID=3080827 RepID=A0ABZ2TFI3_9RHOB|nr:Flp pilus assembly protein CpaB [Roseovarius sp. W115]MDV2930926.1 Flp pilus assembly protein CpaB [Roseovarius sp. W115]